MTTKQRLEYLALSLFGGAAGNLLLRLAKHAWFVAQRHVAVTFR